MHAYDIVFANRNMALGKENRGKLAGYCQYCMWAPKSAPNQCKCLVTPLAGNGQTGHENFTKSAVLHSM